MDLLDEQLTSPRKTLQFKLWVILLWAAFFAIGYLFRFMHWPFNGVLRVIGAGGFMAYSFSFFLLSKERSTIVITCVGLSLLWGLTVVWGVFFNHGYPFNLSGLAAQAVVFAVLFVLHFLSLYLIKRNRKK
jgi:hypothetical protein